MIGAKPLETLVSRFKLPLCQTGFNLESVLLDFRILYAFCLQALEQYAFIFPSPCAMGASQITQTNESARRSALCLLRHAI